MAHSQEPVAEDYLTIPQAADRLGIPTSTLRRAVNKGLVPFHRPFNQRIRVRLSEIIAVIEAQQVGGQVDE